MRNPLAQFSPHLGLGGSWYANATQTFTGSAVTIPVDTEVQSDGIVDWDTATNFDGTILVPGLYLITCDYSFDVSSGTTRSTGRGSLQINSVEVTGSPAFVYNRTAAVGRGQASRTLRKWLDTGDVLRLRAERQAGTNTLVNFANSCGITLTLVGDR